MATAPGGKAPAPRPRTGGGLGLTKSYSGLPLWAWVGIGGVSVAGLYVFVRGYRQASAAKSAPSSGTSATMPGGSSLPTNLLQPIIVQAGAPSAPSTSTPSPGGLPAGLAGQTPQQLAAQWRTLSAAAQQAILAGLTPQQIGQLQSIGITAATVPQASGANVASASTFINRDSPAGSTSGTIAQRTTELTPWNA